MKSILFTSLLTIAVVANGGITPAAASAKGMCSARAVQLAKGSAPGLGSYVRCYQRQFEKCLRDNRDAGTGGYQVHFMCRKTATKECSSLQKYRGTRQRYRG